MPTKRKTYSLVCFECGREFEWEGTENATSRMLPKCCSAECRKSRTRKLDFVYSRTVKRGLPPRHTGEMTGAELLKLVEELKAAKPPMKKATCTVCGREFETTNRLKKACSPECSNKLRRACKIESWRRHYVRKPKTTIEAVCAVCGKPFSYEARSSVPEKFRRKYCSEECSAKAHAEKRREYDMIRNARRRKPKVMKEFETVCSPDVKEKTLQRATFDRSPRRCVVCGKEYVPKARDQKTCSRECAAEAAKRRKRELYAASRALSAPPSPRKCAVCGKEFVPDKHHPHAKTCSKACCKALENGKHKYVRKPLPAPRPCKWCGETFVPDKRHPHRQCCSAKCGEKFRKYGMSEVQRAFVAAGRQKVLAGDMDFDRNPRKCVVCGKEFVPKRSAHTVCSTHCRNVMSARQRSARRQTYERTCVMCGKPFITTGKKRSTCSHECAIRYRSRWADIQKGKQPAEKVVVKAVCKECGKEFEYMWKGTSRKYCSHKCCQKYWNRICNPAKTHRLSNLSPEEAAARKAEAREKKRAYQKAYQAEYQKRPEVIARKQKRAEEEREFRERLRAIREGDLAAMRAANEAARAERAAEKARLREEVKAKAKAEREARREAQLARIAAAEEKRWAKILAVREKRRLVAAASAETRAARIAGLKARRKATRERSLAALMKRHEEARAAARAKAAAVNAAIAASARAAGKEVATAVCKECGCEFEYVPQDRKGTIAGTVPEFCCGGCKARWKYTHGGKEKAMAYMEQIKAEGAHWNGRRFVKGMKKENLRTAWRGQVPGGFGCSCGFASGGELRPEDLCASGPSPFDAGFGEFDYDAYSGA